MHRERARPSTRRARGTCARTRNGPPPDRPQLEEIAVERDVEPRAQSRRGRHAGARLLVRLRSAAARPLPSARAGGRTPARRPRTRAAGRSGAVPSAHSPYARRNVGPPVPAPAPKRHLRSWGAPSLTLLDLDHHGKNHRPAAFCRRSPVRPHRAGAPAAAISVMCRQPGQSTRAARPELVDQIFGVAEAARDQLGRRGRAAVELASVVTMISTPSSEGGGDRRATSDVSDAEPVHERDAGRSGRRCAASSRARARRPSRSRR